MGIDVNTIGYIGVKITNKRAVEAAFEWEDEAASEIHEAGLDITTDRMCGEYCIIGRLLFRYELNEMVQEMFYEEAITRYFLEVSLALRELDIPDTIREEVDNADIQLIIQSEYW